MMPIKSVRVTVNLKPVGLSTPFELSLTHRSCFLILSNSWIRAGKSPMRETAKSGRRGHAKGGEVRARQGQRCASTAAFEATLLTNVI